jgi:hyaluronan synthase
VKGIVRRKKALATLVFGLLAACALAAMTSPRGSVYGVAVFSILAVKLAASFKHHPHTVPPSPDLRVAAVVPVYNEDPALLASCLDSLDRQTYPIWRIVIVDDGSTSVDALEVANRWANGRDNTDVVVFGTNRGKREALGEGFRLTPDADVYLCIDSDGVLEDDAVYEGLRPFADPQVTGVSGLVLASNHRKNLLTRLIDLRYSNAFLYERAAYSTVGSVMCCSGALGFHRGDVVRKYLDDFLGQRFLGRPATFGDDRRLTNYDLLEGKVVMQETSAVHTAVPERLGHFVRQQVRWNKSFFRESLWTVQAMPARKPAFALVMVELTSWLLFTVMLVAALIVAPFRAGAALGSAYLAYLAVMAYARSVRYFEVERPDVGRWQRLGVFALAPLYGVLHMTLLLPLRLYSLATLRVERWGTRDHVEVTAA